MQENTHSGVSLNMAQRWLGICLLSHDECRQPNPDGWLPSFRSMSIVAHCTCVIAHHSLLVLHTLFSITVGGRYQACSLQSLVLHHRLS